MRFVRRGMIHQYKYKTTTDGERNDTYQTNSVHTYSQKGNRSRQTWRLPVSDMTYWLIS